MAGSEFNKIAFNKIDFNEVEFTKTVARIRPQRRNERKHDMIPNEFLETAHAYRVLSDLQPKQLIKVLPLAREGKFARDQIIFREGARSTHLYLIVSGAVALESMAGGKPVPVQTLKAGDAMGWSAISDAGLTHFQARAVAPVTVIAFAGEELRKACESDPELGYALTKQLLELVTDRLDGMRMQLAERGVTTETSGA